MAKQKRVYESVTTPECVLSFPALFEKDPGMDGDKPAYRTTMLFDKKTDLTKLKKAMVKVAKANFGEDADVKFLCRYCLQDGDEKGKPGSKGKWIAKAKTTLARPGVVDAGRNSILDPEEIYSGVIAKVALTVSPYTHPSGDGICFYLNHVQKIKDGERLGHAVSTPEDVFEALELDDDDGDTEVDNSELDALLG